MFEIGLFYVKCFSNRELIILCILHTHQDFPPQCDLIININKLPIINSTFIEMVQLFSLPIEPLFVGLYRDR